MTERGVRDVMTRQVVAVREDRPYKEMVLLPAEEEIGALPVLNGAGEVVGVVSGSDLLYKEEYLHFPSLRTGPGFGQFSERHFGLTRRDVRPYFRLAIILNFVGIRAVSSI
jgi:hypothetical protein